MQGLSLIQLKKKAGKAYARTARTNGLNWRVRIQNLWDCSFKFNKGHDTCQKTQKKLRDLYTIPSSCMKDLISNWCKKHYINLDNSPASIQHWEPSRCSSIASLRNVSAALLDGTSRDYMLWRDHSSVSLFSSDASNCSDSSHVKGMESLKDNPGPLFSSDHWDKAVEDLKTLLEDDDEICYAVLSNGFAKALMTYLKNAYNPSDIRAQRTGA